MAKKITKVARKKNSAAEKIRNELKSIREKVGTKIRQQRKKRDMETKVLASKIGLSQGSISNIEHGKQSVTAERLWQIAVALGYTPNDLLPPVPDRFIEFEKNLRKMEDEEAQEFAKNVIITSDPPSLES